MSWAKLFSMHGKLKNMQIRHIQKPVFALVQLKVIAMKLLGEK